jgi:site-specific DNA recombinase
MGGFMPIRRRNEPVTERGLRRAVSYARVSDKEQELGYSILAQHVLFPPYAAENDLAIEREFVDVHTARKPGRPGFSDMLEYLKKNPGCRVILVEKTDRFYRNFADAAAIEALGVEVHLVKEHRIFSKDSRAVDKYNHGLEVLNAKRYVDNLSEEVQKGMRTKAEQGLWPSYAPLGYRNTIRDDGKRIIVPDAVLGPAIQNLLGWFYTGEYSVQRLARRAYEEGIRFRKSGGRVPVSTLQKILRNPIYMGEFDYGGVRYQGSHEPLVTREVWERIQDILDGRNRKKQRKVTHEFVYSSMVSCGHCGCALVGEVKKRRYVYYHCTGYRGKCGDRTPVRRPWSGSLLRHWGK